MEVQAVVLADPEIFAAVAGMEIMVPIQALLPQKSQAVLAATVLVTLLGVQELAVPGQGTTVQEVLGRAAAMEETGAAAVAAAHALVPVLQAAVTVEVISKSTRTDL